MNSIIEEIFYNLLESNQNFQRVVPSQQELDAYENIRNDLTEKQKNAFDHFEELYSQRYGDSEKELYFLGFRMGAQMAFELMNADFTLKFP